MLNGPDGATIALGVDLVDAHRITSAHPYAGVTIFPAQSAQQLYHLSVQLEGDESIAFRIEAGGRARLVPNAGLQCQRGGRLETKEKIPKRSCNSKLEQNASQPCQREQSCSRDDGVQDQSDSAKADKDTEDRPWR